MGVLIRRYARVCVWVALAVGSVAKASVSVSVDSAGGYLRYGGTDYVVDHLVSTRVLLMWSANDAIEDIQWDGARLVFAGGDRTLRSFSLDDSGVLSVGTLTLNWNDPGYTFAGQAEFESGYVYLVVFDSANPTAGDHYVAGSGTGVGFAMQLTPEQVPPLPPDRVDPTQADADNLVPVDTTITVSRMLKLVVEGRPGRYGWPEVYGYGTNDVPYGTRVVDGVSGSAGVSTRYRCTGWTGSGSVPASGSSNRVSFTATNDSTLTWNWAVEHWLDTTASGSGAVDVADGWFPAGTSVTITATGLPHYHLQNWSGDTGGCAVNGKRITAPMTQPRAITAHFAIDQWSWRVVSDHGTPTPPVGFSFRNYGTVIPNRVTPIHGAGQTQYVCRGWAMVGNEPRSGTGTNFTMTITNNAVLTWLWKTNYFLVTGSGGNGSVDTASGWFAKGSNVTLTATATAHYHFAAWSGDTNGCAVNGNRITAPMTGPRTILAAFAVDRHTLRVDSARGATVPPVGTHTNEWGTSVGCRVSNAIVPAGMTRYVCMGWTGTGSVPGSGSATNVTVTLTNDSVIAWQWKTQYRGEWRVASGGGGSVSLSNGWFDAGTTGVTVRAQSAVGYHFVNWTGTVTSAVNPLTLTMDRPYDLRANFAINRYTITATVGPFGSIVPSGAVEVPHGSATNFTIVPDAAYHVDELRVNGARVAATNRYRFLNVTSNQSIHATFAPDRPTASFTAAPVTGAAPVQVVFTDRSFGIIATREWDFQNDGTVDRTDPADPIAFTYSVAGQYSVRLKVTGPGGTHTLIRTNYVGVAPPPTNRAPVCAVAQAQIFLSSLGEKAVLDASPSWDADRDPLFFSWREWYQNPQLGLIPVGSGSCSNLPVYFPAPGRYRFDVRVSDGMYPSRDVRPITVYVPGLKGVVELQGSDGSVRVPDARIAFYGTASDATRRTNEVDVALSDSLGRYTLATLMPTNYHFFIQRSGFTTSTVQQIAIQRDPGFEDDRHTFQVERSLQPSLAGRILDASNRPIQRATIWFLGVSGAPRQDTTGSSGDFELTDIPYGSWVMQIQAAGFRPEVRDVNVGPVMSNLVYHLSPAAGTADLRGRVILSGSDRPVAGARVVLGQGAADTYTRADGTYEFRNLPRGSYVLSTTKTGYEPLRMFAVQVRGGANVVDLAVSFAGSGPTVFGTVVDQYTGLPIRLATVGVDSQGLLIRSDVTDYCGFYQLRDVPTGSNQLVRVAAPGYRTAVFTVSVDNYLEMNVILRRAANWRLPQKPSAEAPIARVAQADIFLNSLSGSTVLDGSPSVGSNLGYLWRESPDNPVMMLDATTRALQKPTLAGFEKPGIYLYELQVRSGVIVSPNVAVATVYVPGLAGNVHESPSDGVVGLPQTTVRAYTNYGHAAAFRADTYSDSIQVQDAGGDFVLRNLKPGAYWLSARKTGYRDYGPVRHPVNYSTAARRLQVNMARDEGTFDGRVTDVLTGLPVENVRVVVATGVRSESFRTTTDGQGYYRLYSVPQGSHTVMYLREGYESWTVKISISARTTKNYGLTPLSGGQMATLEGRVTTDYAGIALPLSHAEVIVGGGFARTFTDANGFYALAGLPPGLYDSTVRQDGYRAASLSDVGFLDVQVGANQADKALAFSEHGPGIRGVVVDENNVPIENAVITILPPPQVRLPSPLAGAKSRTGGVADEGRRRTAAGATASDAAGTFQLNGVPDGERRIRIEVPGRGVFTNVISVSGNMEAVFSLTEASRIPYEWRTPYTNWLGRHFRTTTIGRTVEAGDTDGDGVPNWAEFVCGTDPTNRASVFAPRMETAGGGRSQFVMDVAATGRVYDVYWKTNLMQTAWQRAMLTMTGTPGRIALPTGGVHARGFYRAAVRLR